MPVPPLARVRPVSVAFAFAAPAGDPWFRSASVPVLVLEPVSKQNNIHLPWFVSAPPSAKKIQSMWLPSP